jgi:glycosyltransferase involved in cell wall biosynthesis
MPQARSRNFLIVPQFGRAHGGVGASAERFVSLLRDSCDFTVFVPDRELPSGTYTEQIRPGLEILHFGPPSEHAVGLQFAADLMLHRHELRPADRILGFYAGEWSYAAALTAALLERPFAVFLRGNDIDLGMFSSAAFELSYMLRAAERVFCVSSELQRKAAALCPEAKTVCVPNGVDPLEFPFQEAYIPASPPVLGLFGEIKEKKALDFLLTAIPWQDFRLRIVGSLRPSSAKMLQAFLQLHPEACAHIEHLPYVKSATELVKEYYAVDILCLPSYHEGMANVMLEGMSCGKLLLCSAVGGAVDVITHGENGFLHRPRDISSFQKSLAEAAAMLNSGSDAFRFQASARVRENFSWNKERERYKEFFS